MDKPKSPLSFEVKTYALKNTGSGKYSLKIDGQATGRPGKRFTLRPALVKITSAKIARYHKNKQFDYGLKRINYLPTRQQLRLHTDSLLYPGRYEIELELTSKVPLKSDELPISFL